MALITISGYPCSGKTRRADQIKAFLDQKLNDPSYQGPKLNVAVVSDDSLGLSRSAYNDSGSEKPARGALFTAMQRQMGSDTILIADALNYIKGFRYQTYCAARELKIRVCTVYVVATPDLCREWNAKRDESHSYAPETLDNLFMRYEEPSSMARWDAPLFTVLWDDQDIPGEGIWDAIIKGNIKPPNSGTLSVAKAPTDALHTLEQTSATIVSAIINSIPLNTGSPITLSLSDTLKLQITLPIRNITLSELQRLKRQFVTVHKKAITLGTTEKGSVDWEEQSIAEKFVTYLEEHIRP